jgi:hypothetical protein
MLLAHTTGNYLHLCLLTKIVMCYSFSELMIAFFLNILLNINQMQQIEVFTISLLF